MTQGDIVAEQTKTVTDLTMVDYRKGIKRFVFTFSDGTHSLVQAPVEWVFKLMDEDKGFGSIEFKTSGNACP